MGEDVFYLVKEKSVSSFLALKNQQRHSLRAECIVVQAPKTVVTKFVCSNFLRPCAKLKSNISK